MKLFYGKKIEKKWKGLSLLLIVTLVLCGLFVPAKKVKAADQTAKMVLSFNTEGLTQNDPLINVFANKTITLTKEYDEEAETPFSFDVSANANEGDLAFLKSYRVSSDGKLLLGYTCQSEDITTVDGDYIYTGDKIGQSSGLKVYPNNFTEQNEYSVHVTLTPFFTEFPVTLDLNFTSGAVQTPFYSGEYTLNNVISYYQETDDTTVLYGVFPVNLSSAPSQPSPQPATKGITAFSDSWYYGESQAGLYILRDNKMVLAEVNNNVNTNLYVQLSTLEGADYSWSANLWPQYNKINLPVKYDTDGAGGQISGGANQILTSSDIDGDVFKVRATLPAITDLDPGYVHNGWSISFNTTAGMGSPAIYDGNDEQELGSPISAGTNIVFHIPKAAAQNASNPFSVDAVATFEPSTAHAPTLNISIDCEGGHAGGESVHPDSDTPEQIDGEDYYSYTFYMPTTAGGGFTTAVWYAGEASNDGLFLVYRDSNKLSGSSVVTSGDRITIKATRAHLSDTEISWTADGFEILRNGNYSFILSGEVHYYLTDGFWSIGDDEYTYHTSGRTDITKSLRGSGMYNLHFSKYQTTK